MYMYEHVHVHVHVHVVHFDQGVDVWDKGCLGSLENYTSTWHLYIHVHVHAL